MKREPVSTALIGFGMAGRYLHAPFIAAVPQLALSAIVTSRGDQVASLYPDARRMSVGEVFADPTIELVVIATPNQSHAPLALAALAAGKHVVIDKPFALDPVEGKSLIDAARDAGRVLSVYHNRRWDGDLLTVQRVMGEGVLGEIRLAELRWDRFRPTIKQGWREKEGPGSGLLADLGPHLIDQALLLFGEPVDLQADVLTQRGGRTDDYFEITLRYPSLRVILSASNLVAAPRPRFAIHGTRGSFVKHGIDPQEAALRAGCSPGTEGFGEEDPASWGSLTLGDRPPVSIASERGDWRRFYAAMASAILDGGPPPVAPEQALAGLKIIAAARAGAEGRQPVSFAS